jgi:kynurenine 3-monooxygenase
VEEKKICIAGAGLVGSLLSLFLSKNGYSCDIYERRPDMRKQEVKGGRSINLALSDRGWRALEEIGVANEIMEVAIPMYGRMIHHQNGETKFLSYGNSDQAIYSVSRAGLNEKMMDLAESYGNTTIFFDHKCEEVEKETGKIIFRNNTTGEKISRIYPVIFGADGAFSAIRLSLMLQTDRLNYSQQYLEHGYKELVIPANAEGKWQLEPNALHIWPRKSFMLIALPNMDGSFTCTLFLSFEGEVSFSKLTSKTKVLQFFSEYFPDALTLMPTLLDDFFSNPASSLVTIQCNPWNHKGNICLIGDAAHAIVPFYGQGMNAGFEDCTVLHKLMETYGNDWQNIFTEFSSSRKKDSDAIAVLALRNFTEMRDLVADPFFLAKRKIERELAERFPEKWVPTYSMVTFSDMPYSEALKKANIQEKILEELVNHPNPEEVYKETFIDFLLSRKE